MQKFKLLRQPLSLPHIIPWKLCGVETRIFKFWCCISWEIFENYKRLFDEGSEDSEIYLSILILIKFGWTAIKLLQWELVENKTMLACVHLVDSGRFRKFQSLASFSLEHSLPIFISVGDFKWSSVPFLLLEIFYILINQPALHILHNVYIKENIHISRST